MISHLKDTKFRSGTHTSIYNVKTSTKSGSKIS